MAKLREVAKRAWYLGSKYECAVCHAKTRTRKTYSFDLPVLRELDVVGGEYYPNDDCPICYANQRSRLLFAYLTNSITIKKGWNVFHVAPELALYRYVFRDLDINYHPIDLSPERYREISGVQKVDITATPFPDQTFDLVLCNHVLEHIPDDGLAMRELRRILKPNGIALLQVPLGKRLSQTIEDPSITDPTERERRFGQFDHVRIYEERDYLRRLRAAGFEVETIAAADIAGPNGVERYGLNPRESLVVARGGQVTKASDGAEQRARPEPA
jgi:SAM-dependent methyltransferase